MVTSANLSTQAWGSAASASGDVRICSYEIGVVVWPNLFQEVEGKRVEMVPVFKQDMPGATDDLEGAQKVQNQQMGNRIVGFRMPYDLPLVPYNSNESPWCATSPCSEPDWMGRTWPGFGEG